MKKKTDNILVGKTLNSIKMLKGGYEIAFICEEGIFIAECYAECCSHTWIEHIELPTLGFPAFLTNVEDLDMPDLGDMPDRQFVTYYGCKITTSRGEIIIDYRNESNGNYGGGLCWPHDSSDEAALSAENGWIDVVEDV